MKFSTLMLISFGFSFFMVERERRQLCSARQLFNYCWYFTAVWSRDMMLMTDEACPFLFLYVDLVALFFFVRDLLCYPVAVLLSCRYARN